MKRLICWAIGQYLSFSFSARISGCDFQESGVEYDGELYYHIIKCRRCGNIDVGWSEVPPSHFPVRDIKRVAKDKWTALMGRHKFHD